MIRYVLRRLLLLIPVLFGVTMITFTLTRIIPGDPISLMISPMASKEARDQLTERAGLNDPIVIQYVNYIKGIFHGDLGNSFVTRQPVLNDLTSRFMPTLELTLIAMFLAILFGVAPQILFNYVTPTVNRQVQSLAAWTQNVHDASSAVNLAEVE